MMSETAQRRPSQGQVLPNVPLEPVLSPTGTGVTAAQQQQAATKQSLKQWWGKFTKQQQQRDGQRRQDGSSSGESNVKDPSPTNANAPGTLGKGVFGVPLTDSLKYAGVAISMIGPDGVNQVYGYIPIVVAKCGLFLKQKAVTVEGVFRISGSTRRMKELQDIFDRGPTYGKDLVWGPWSVHDAANVLRRYLNQMPEPLVPADQYDAFRNALPPRDRMHDTAAQAESVSKYKTLIASLPSSSKYLFSYVLDLLNVFARNSDTNLMPASNLAVVFQPGLIRSPSDAQELQKIPGEVAIPGASAAYAGVDALSPPPSFPNMPSLSRSVSAGDGGPHSSALDQASGSQASYLSSNAGYLQKRQDELKNSQEILEFLISHQDQFVSLPTVTTPVAPLPVSAVPIPIASTSKQPEPAIARSVPRMLSPPPGRTVPSTSPKLAAPQSASLRSTSQPPSRQSQPTSPVPSPSHPSAVPSQSQNMLAPINLNTPPPSARPSADEPRSIQSKEEKKKLKESDKPKERDKGKEKDVEKQHEPHVEAEKEDNASDRAPRKLQKKRAKDAPARPMTPSTANMLSTGVSNLVQGPAAFTLWEPTYAPQTAYPQYPGATQNPTPAVNAGGRNPSVSIPQGTAISPGYSEDRPLSGASSATVRRSQTLPGSTSPNPSKVR